MTQERERRERGERKGGRRTRENGEKTIKVESEKNYSRAHLLKCVLFYGYYTPYL